MARKNNAPGGGATRRGARLDDEVGNNNTEFTGKDTAGKGGHLSGFYDTRDNKSKLNGRVKQLARDIAQRAVGAASDWEDYVEEAQAEITWENYEYYLERKGWKKAGTYPYHNATGYQVLYEAIRYNYVLMPTKKIFKLRHQIDNGPWMHDGGPVRVPYNLPELLKHPDKEINLVEGEKGVDRVMQQRLLASCTQGQNWTEDVAQYYADRTVNVNMDHDDAGRDNEETALEWLRKVNAKVRIIRLPGLLPKQGLDDWLETHSIEEYRELVAKTPVIGRIEPYSFPPEETLPRYEWLLGKHLLRGTVSGTAAMGGTGKSNISIVEALAMASGKVLLHDQVPKTPLRVVLINLEDSRETMDKRIAAVMREHGLSKADIGDRLIVVASGEIVIEIATQMRGGNIKRNEDDIRRLTELMFKHRADVLSIDSFVRTHGVNENDNKAVQTVVSCFEEVARTAACAVHLWHHTRKMGGDQASVESARGAQAFIDACRSIRILETMSKKTRDELLGVMPEIGEPGYYFREFNGKRNFAPPSDQSNWFKYVSIKLRNWTSEFEDDGDNIGVVTPWQYPALILPPVTPADIDRVLATIKGGGPWRADPRSTAEPWVGVPIARALTVNLLHPAAKRVVTKLIKDLLRTGQLTLVKRFDPHGDERDYVEVPVET